MAVVARRALAERGRMLVGFAIGNAAMVALMASVWPTLRDNDELQQVIDQYPKSVLALFGGSTAIDMTSAAGFLQIELLGLIAPLLFVLFTVAFGAGTLAGDEEHGLLELVQSAGITRWAVYSQKALALLVADVVLALTFVATLVVVALAADMALDPAGVAATGAALALLGWLFGALALAVGGGTGHRAAAISVPAVAAVAAYLVANLAELAEWLEPVRPLSPVYQTVGRRPLETGFAWGPLLAFTGASLLLAAVGGWIYDRRDIAA